MRNHANSGSDAFLQTFGEDLFSSCTRAAMPEGFVYITGAMASGVAAVVIAALLAFTPIGGKGAQAEQTVLDKSDRIGSAASDACRDQAWGAWSAECATAISGTGPVRKIRFVTVEHQPATPNTTVLTRIPGKS